MAKAKKTLSVVLAALMLVFTFASYVPAMAAKAPAVPKLEWVAEPAFNETGDRISMTVTSPNYGGQVEYRVMLWNGTTKTYGELWPNDPGYYYKNWKPAGNYKFNIHWPAEKLEPGAYSITVLVRRAGAKVPYDNFVKSEALFVGDDKISEIAAIEATVDEGAKYELPAQVEAKMSDNTTKMVDVNWGDAKVDTTKPGEFTFKGKVEGYEKDVELKLTVKEVAYAITAKAIGAKKLEISFNKEVKDTAKAVFTVKNGFVVYTPSKITWAEDNKSVVLENLFNYAAGEYTITVTGLTEKAIDPATLKVEAPKNTEVVITSTQLEKSAATALGVQLNNQYGEKVTNTPADFTVTAYNKTKSVMVPVTGTNLDLTAAAYADEIVVTAIHNTTALTATKTLTVVPAAASSQLQFGNIVLPEDIARLYVSGTFKVALKAVNQYNVEVEFAAQLANADGITGSEKLGDIKLYSSDNTIVSVDEMTIDSKGILNFTAKKAGTVIITAMSVSGATAQLAVQVSNDAALKTFVISNPATISVANENIVIPYMATDSFGEAIATKDFAPYQASVKFNITSSAGETVNTSWSAKNELVIKPAKDGIIVVTPIVGTTIGQSITITVNPEATPTTFIGVKNKVTKFLATGTSTIKAANLIVKDQYGRDFDFTGAGYAVTATITGDGNVILTNSDVLATAGVTLTGATDGAEKVTLTISKAEFTSLTHEYSVTTITEDDVKSYAITAIPTIYAKADQTVASTHAVEVKTVGKTSTGELVAIPDAYFTSVASSDISVINVDAAAKTIFGLKAGSSTITVFHGATKLATTTVATSEVAPYAVSAAFDEDATYEVAALGTLDLNALLAVEDQYGVDMANNGVWVSSKPAVATVDTKGTVTHVAAGTTTISFVTANGVVAQVKVVAK